MPATPRAFSFPYRDLLADLRLPFVQVRSPFAREWVPNGNQETLDGGAMARHEAGVALEASRQWMGGWAETGGR